MATYQEAGFNNFLDRSIGSDPNILSLDDYGGSIQSDLSLDQLQVSGRMGGVFQSSGSIEGGRIKDLTLDGDLTLNGRMFIGGKAFTFDGRTIRMTINDGTNDRIIVGNIP